MLPYHTALLRGTLIIPAPSFLLLPAPCDSTIIGLREFIIIELGTKADFHIPSNRASRSRLTRYGPQAVCTASAGVEVVSALKDEIERRCGSDTRVDPIERFSFYEEAGGCFAVIQTMERRPYGNVILVKGCVGSDGNDLRPVTPYHCPMRTPGQSKTD